MLVQNDLQCSKRGLLVGLAPDLIEHDVAMLQYADDTVICIDHDPERTINLKILIFCFRKHVGVENQFYEKLDP